MDPFKSIIVSYDNNTERDFDEIYRNRYWTYEVFIPISCFFGIFGNLLLLYVLSSDAKKFCGFIYVYMKGLALIDIVIALFNIQVKLPRT